MRTSSGDPLCLWEPMRTNGLCEKLSWYFASCDRSRRHGGQWIPHSSTKTTLPARSAGESLGPEIWCSSSSARHSAPASVAAVTAAKIRTFVFIKALLYLKTPLKSIA